MSIASTLTSLRSATLGAAARQAALGRAYQSVAQTGAIAIQDAADYQRNMLSMCATAQGLALTQMLAGNEEGALVLAAATGAVEIVASQFVTIGTNAATVVQGFPTS